MDIALHEKKILPQILCVYAYIDRDTHRYRQIDIDIDIDLAIETVGFLIQQEKNIYTGSAKELSY